MGCYRTRGGAASASGSSDHGGSSCAGDSEEVDWEVRPCGMLVQKRPDVPPHATPTPDDGASTGTGRMGWKKKKTTKQQQPDVIRVRVAYGGDRHDVAVHHQATFGELKKLLSVETGLRPADQRLAYRGRERRDADYLDLCGVKEGSKVVLEEDPCSKERRYVEMKKAAREQSIQKAVGDVAMEVERLADQVACIDNSVSRGAKVAEAQITTLIEMLMRQAVWLDAIPLPAAQDNSSSSSLASQKHLQAKRIQECVETLDGLLMSNARINNTRNLPNTTAPATNPRAVVVTTTHWETFDAAPAVATRPSVPATTATMDWEFFD